MDKKITNSTTGEFLIQDGVLLKYNGQSNEVIIPDGVISIEREAFFGSRKRITGITLPDSIKTIGDFAFEGCTALSRIYIPEGVTKIGIQAFVLVTI